ncbi:hypothetical protein V2J09_006515 [Rumex salicifolius]
MRTSPDLIFFHQRKKFRSLLQVNISQYLDLGTATLINLLREPKIVKGKLILNQFKNEGELQDAQINRLVQVVKFPEEPGEEINNGGGFQSMLYPVFECSELDLGELALKPWIRNKDTLKR